MRAPRDRYVLWRGQTSLDQGQEGCLFNRERVPSEKDPPQKKSPNTYKNKGPHIILPPKRDLAEIAGETGGNWFLSPHTRWSPAVNDLC